MKTLGNALILLAVGALGGCTLAPDNLALVSAQVVGEEIQIKLSSPIDIYQDRRSPDQTHAVSYFCADLEPERASFYSSLNGRDSTNRPPLTASETLHAVAIRKKHFKIIWNKNAGKPSQEAYDLRQSPQDICIFIEIINFAMPPQRSNILILSKDMLIRTLDSDGREIFNSP